MDSLLQACSPLHLLETVGEVTQGHVIDCPSQDTYEMKGDVIKNYPGTRDTDSTMMADKQTRAIPISPGSPFHLWETDTRRKQPPRIRVLGEVGGQGRAWLGSSALGIRAGISGVDVPAEP